MVILISYSRKGRKEKRVLTPEKSARLVSVAQKRLDRLSRSFKRTKKGKDCLGHIKIWKAAVRKVRADEKKGLDHGAAGEMIRYNLFAYRLAFLRDLIKYAKKKRAWKTVINALERQEKEMSGKAR